MSSISPATILRILYPHSSICAAIQHQKQNETSYNNNTLRLNLCVNHKCPNFGFLFFSYKLLAVGVEIELFVSPLNTNRKSISELVES